VAKEILKQLGLKLAGPFAFGLTVAAPWALWQSSFESFRVDVGEALVAAVFALVVSLVATSIAYWALGSQVERLVMAALAIGSGRAPKSLSDRRLNRIQAIADVLAAGGIAVLSALALGVGIRDTHAAWVLSGFIGFGLAAIHLLSALANVLLSRRLRRQHHFATLSADQQEKSGEIPGVFVSLAAVAIAISGAIASAIPGCRYAGKPQPLAYGTYADGCVGEDPGCEPEKLLTFEVDSADPIELTVFARSKYLLLRGGEKLKRDGRGERVIFKLNEGSTYTRKAVFKPEVGAKYSVRMTGKGAFSVRYRRAR